MLTSSQRCSMWPATMREFVEDAVHRHLENEAFGLLLDEIEAEAGPVPEVVDAEAVPRRRG